MEQVLNFPYEENINLSTLEEVVRNKFPSYNVKKGKRSVMMYKNFLVAVLFIVKADGDKRQLFYKTKMNVWAWVFILLMYTFCGCYSWSEWGHYYDEDIMVIAITGFIPLIVWWVYFFMQFGLTSKVRHALEQELPQYLTNRVEYFFPPQSVTTRWKNGMNPVAWLILTWGILELAKWILLTIPDTNVILSDFFGYRVQYYGNCISNLLMLAIATIFVTKNFNHQWQIAKFLFLAYVIWLLLQNILVFFDIRINFGSPVYSVVFWAIESFISWGLMAVFSYYFYCSLRNSSSLYLLKICTIWIIFSVIFFIDHSCLYLTHLNYYDYGSSGYQDYEIARKSFQVRAYIWSFLVNCTYTIGFMKAFFTLKNNTPQGIGIRI